MSEVSLKTNSKRIVLLDVYRGIAALAVVMFHLVYRGYLGERPSDVNFGAFGELFKYGYLGVDFFFMISGFVISFSAAQGNVGKFVHSRFIRLFPAFFICCTLTYATILLLDDGRFAISLWAYFLNLTMVSGFVGIPYVDGVYWSLLVEIQFYCMVAALLWMNGSKHLENCIRLWLAASIVLYFYHIRGANRIMLSEYAPLFSAGATFYYCYAQKVTLARLVTLALSFAATLAWSIANAEKLSVYYSQTFDYKMIIILEAGFFLAFALVLFRVEPRWPRLWIFIGTATYPLYLLHQHIGFIGLNRLHPHMSDTLNLSLNLLLVFALTFLVSEVLEPALRKQIQSRLGELPKSIYSLRGLSLPKVFGLSFTTNSSRR